MLCPKKDQSLLFFHKKLRDPDYLSPPPSSACVLYLMIGDRGWRSSRDSKWLLQLQPSHPPSRPAARRNWGAKGPHHSHLQSLLGNNPPNLLLCLLSQIIVTWSYLASVDAEKCSLWTLADNEVSVTIRDAAWLDQSKRTEVLTTQHSAGDQVVPWCFSRPSLTPSLYFLGQTLLFQRGYDLGIEKAYQF